MSSTSLKYGHIIRIKPNDPQIVSYITSKSYTDPKLYFQTYGHNEAPERIDVSNYRQSLFQVLPTSSFQINDEMNSMKTEAKKAETAPRAKTQEEQFKAMIDEKRGKPIFFGDKVVFKHLDSKHFIYGSFDCAQSGIGAFKIDLRRQLSEKLVFQLFPYRTYEKNGDEISLDAPLKIYHYQTQCYISYCKEPIFLDRDEAKLTTKEGEGQDFDRPCDQPFLKLFSYQKLEEGQQFEEINEEQQKSKPNREEQNDQTSRYQIINLNTAKKNWKFEMYLDVEEKPNKQIIRDHDIVYLLHTKDDKYLSPNNFDKDIFLKKRLEVTDPDFIFDGLWQIAETSEPVIDEQEMALKNARVNAKKGLQSSVSYPLMSLNMSFRKPNIMASTQIQKKDDKKEKGKKTTYSLRHLISGRILYFTQFLNQTSENVEFSLVHPHDENFREQRENQKYGLVLLQCLESNLVDGALTRFNIDNGKYYMEVKSQKKATLAIKSKEDVEGIDPEEQFQKVREGIFGEEDEVEQNYKSNFQTQNLEAVKDASQHGFRIYKIDQSIKQVALMVMSSQEVILKFKNFIQYFDIESPQYIKCFNMTLLNNMINVIKGLIGFIYNCQYNKIVSSGNSPVQLRQRAFDEIGMIQLVTKLIHQINKQDKVLKQLAEAKNKNSEYRKIRTIYSLGYEVLESIAASNPLLKIKISVYLRTYLNHILKPENRVVYKSIQEILDGNQLALEKKVKQTYIRELIATFLDDSSESSTDPADLQFLSRLCLCKNRTVQKNQNSVFLAFYEENKSVNSTFDFRQDHGKYQIASKITRKQNKRLRTLPQLFLQCQMSQTDGVVDPSKGHWNYFIQYLNLLADVCVHRNITPLRYISDNLPLHTLEEFLQQKLVRNKLLHQPFIRLIHHAFIQNQNYKQISRITKVKNWNQLGSKSFQKTKHTVSQQISNIINIVVEYIKKINLRPWSQGQPVPKTNQQLDEEPQSIEFDPDNMTSLKNINTFLQILKSTLILGFWPKMQDLKRLVPYMLKILSFDIEYAKRILKNPKVRASIVHVSEEDLANKVYRRVKQQLRLNKPNITLLVQCKVLAAKILDIIIDYEFNIRVSSITKYFKDVQEQEVDLQNYPYKEYEFKKKWKEDKEYDIFRPQNEKEGYLMNEKLWIDKIDTIIKDGNVFEYCGDPNAKAQEEGKGLYENINWMLALFEAFIYGDKELTEIVLSILIRTTNQRRNLLNTFKEIILVAGGNLNQLNNRVNTTRNSLLKLATQQVYYETHSLGHLWKKCRNGPVTQSNSLGTIQELAFLTIAMKKNEIQTQARASRLYAMTDLYPFKNFDENLLDYELEQESDRSYLIITEKDENNPLNQNLIKSQDHHLIVLTFIKLMQKIPKQKYPMMALHASYNFLTVLVWNNIENKNQLGQFLIEAEPHISINVGCIDFIHEMYKNNSKLVLKTDVTRIVHKIIDEANKQDIKYYHKSKLLDFLRTICLFDNKGIEKNQNIVMQIISQYQVSDNNQIVYLKVQDGISKTIETGCELWMKNYRETYEKSWQQYADLQVSPELFYVATFFQIFGCLIENQNKVNIGKCTNMHPYEFLIKTIRIYRQCWPVTRHLRSYINKLYYFSTREKDSQLFSQFISWQLENIQQELKEILVFIVNAPDYHTIRINNPIRYSYIGSYIFLSLQECLHSLCLMFEHHAFSKHISMALGQEGKQSEDIYFLLLFIIQMLEHFMKTIDGRYINKYLATTSELLKKKVSECPLKVAQRYFNHFKALVAENMARHSFSSEDVMFRKNYVFHENKGFWRHLIDWNANLDQAIARDAAMQALAKKTDQLGSGGGGDSDNKKRRELMLQKIYLANIQKLLLRKDPQPRGQLGIKQEGGQQFGNKQQETIEQGNDNQLPKNLVTSQSQRFKVKNERFSNAELKNMIINQRRKKLVKFIQINPDLSSYAQDQTARKLYEGFANLSLSSMEKHDAIEVVGREDVIRTIVDMNKKDPKAIKLEYKIELVKMMTSFIQKQSPSFQKDFQQWSFSEEQAKGLEQAQIFLNDCGCAEFLCSLIENDMNQSIKMANEIILFGICMLYNKNQSVQNSILSILKKDEKNAILSQFDQLIKKNSTSIAYYKPYEAKHEYPIPMNYSDTFDFYADTQKIMARKFTYIPETVLQQKEFEEKMQFLQRIFIFLKVLCEGSKQEIKNFIRDQSDGVEDRGVNVQSINFISVSAAQLKRQFANFRMEILKVPFAIVDFINEVTRIPCIRNQLYLCEDTTYFEDFANLQKMVQAKKNLDKQQIKRINYLFAENIKTIISCLQGNHQKSRKSLISGELNIYYTMIFKVFIENLQDADEHWKFESAEELEELMMNVKRYQGQILRLFNITTVITKLRLKYPKFNENLEYELRSANVSDYFQLFAKNMLGIQINMEKSSEDNEQRQIIYFPAHPVYAYLSRGTRDIIMQSIDRSTQRDKIIGLINTTQEISQEIDYNFDLDHNYYFQISASKISKFQSISLTFAISISILITILASVLYYPEDEDIEYDLGSYYFFIQILSVLQFSFASLYVVLWLKNHCKLAIGKYQLSIKAEQKNEGKEAEPTFVEQWLFKVPIIKILYCLIFYDKEFPGIILFMFGSIAGTFYQPEWFSILIMIIMMKKMNVLRNIVDSITSKIDILLMLSFLGVSFIGIFSIFSLGYYVKSLYEEETPEQHCETVFQCIKVLYIKGQINSQVDSFQSGRFVYDMMYMIFMDILFNAIIGGVLTDTFSELDEKHQQIIEDKENNCFICGINQEALQKKNEEVKTHYKKENHKLWNYVFYIYNLKLKKDKVGLDYIIFNQILNEDVGWIPVESGDTEDIGETIKALEEAIQAERDYVQKIEVSQS